MGAVKEETYNQALQSINMEMREFVVPLLSAKTDQERQDNNAFFMKYDYESFKAVACILAGFEGRSPRLLEALFDVVKRDEKNCYKMFCDAVAQYFAGLLQGLHTIVIREAATGNTNAWDFINKKFSQRLQKVQGIMYVWAQKVWNYELKKKREAAAREEERKKAPSANKNIRTSGFKYDGEEDPPNLDRGSYNRVWSPSGQNAGKPRWKKGSYYIVWCSKRVSGGEWQITDEPTGSEINPWYIHPGDGSALPPISGWTGQSSRFTCQYGTLVYL